ncbi:hypothetical protein GCM10008942_41020 [Rhizomicrobium electricum]|uniref:VWA domain-containing protein n=2 Tax=Rhizomicrobium electricum TaxID=480070 RepID=A0ABN1FC89_9PROT
MRLGDIMRGFVLGTVTAMALLGGGALALQVSRGYPDQNTLHPERIIIGLDLSKSNPLIDNPAFAARVGQRIAGIVSRLGMASEVHIRTFGSYDPASNGFAYDTVISVRARPERVAAEIQRLIANTPRLVASGRWKSQQKTNILAFLDNSVRAVGCGGMPTTIILASDGIEDSEYARLAQGNGLPRPDRRLYRGCVRLAIFGIGQGTGSPVETSRLRQQWDGWARDAGFTRFEALNDW